jgi:phosphotransferase system  glucose/maltose/N-acetylglucosamine-specific IIC component
MKKFLNSMLSDVDGQVSSKRFVTLVAFLCVVVAFISNIFAEIPLQEFVFDGMLYLVGAGLGFSTVEKFSRNKGTGENE